MMRKLIGKCALALVLSSAAAVPLAAGAAPAAQAATPVIHFDGSPGTSAPPATLGPYTMTPAAPDSRRIGSAVSDVTLPDGTMTFSPAVFHLRVGDGWSSWSNGYKGDVYAIIQGSTLTMTLPAGTGAFYFYAEPNSFSATIEAVAQDGTTSGPVTLEGAFSARYFGFYGTGGATIKTIEVTSSVTSGFAVGEFGVGSDALQVAGLHQAVQGVGTGKTLATIVALAQQQLSAGHPQQVCLTLNGFILEVKLEQESGHVPAATAAQLIADTADIETILDC